MFGVTQEERTVLDAIKKNETQRYRLRDLFTLRDKGLCDFVVHQSLRPGLGAIEQLHVTTDINPEELDEAYCLVKCIEFYAGGELKTEWARIGPWFDCHENLQKFANHIIPDDQSHLWYVEDYYNEEQLSISEVF